MNRKYLYLILLAFILCLSGCGSAPKEPSNQEIFDIRKTEKQLFDIEETENYRFFGTQYYQGQPVQLWQESRYFDETGQVILEGDVYLHREDGSRELLFQGLPLSYLSAGEGWLDDQGRFYILEADGIRGLDTNGEELFHIKTGENVLGICQTADGQTAALIHIGGVTKLVLVDPLSGRLEEKLEMDGSFQLITGGKEGVLVLGSEGLYEINLTDGSREYYIRWTGTSYSWEYNFDMEAFRRMEDGSVEILLADGRAETLCLVPVGQDRTLLTFRDISVPAWLKEQIVEFNRKNEAYYVVVEEKPEDMDIQTFRERTDLEIAAGSGADIISSSAAGSSYSLLEKGGFADLRPYMEEAGIEEEAYQPYTFSCWQKEEAVYGINIMEAPRSIWMDAAIAENANPDIYTLVENLLAYEKEAVFMEGYSSEFVLQYLLRGSQDLWGMVDWDKKSCDLSGDLFAGIMEAADRYGDEEYNENPPIAGWLYWSGLEVYIRDTYKLTETGKEEAGYLYDDGYHAYLIERVLAMNVNSPHKEGVWEFFCFLLTEEIQERMYRMSGNFPANRQVWEAVKAEPGDQAAADISFNLKMEDIHIPETQIAKEMDAHLETLTKKLEDARPFPMRTEPILNIIYEEAESYFSGLKSLEEVTDVMENRIRLYLQEIG